MIGEERPFWQEVISLIGTIGWASESIIQAYRNFRLKKYKPVHIACRDIIMTTTLWLSMEPFSI